MKSESQLNLSLLDKLAPLESQEANEKLIIHKEKLLQFICRIKTASSLLILRDGISVLKNQLDNLLVRDSLNEDCTIELSKNSLFQNLRQIEESLTLERAKYYVERFEKGILEIKTSKINDINLNRWKEYEDIITDSLWIMNKRDSSGVHTAGYWGNFVPQIPNQMMKRYTKKGDWVLDTFAGCGTTLIEAQRLGRNCIGIELQESIADKARKLVASEPNKYEITIEVNVGDSTTVDYRALLKKHNQKWVQLVIMHPPYFDIIKFSNDTRDLSNAASVDAFLTMLRSVAKNALAVLDKGRYLVLVIGDKYSKGEWIPLGFSAMNEIVKLGCSLKSIIVKNFEGTTGKRAQKELWRYRALVGGFYIFKHEYIFLFKKQ